MGLLDLALNVVKDQLGGSNGGQNNELLNEVIGLISNNKGGLAGLVNSLQQGGLGDAVASWVGTGENQPVSPTAMQQALGGDMIRSMAQKIGLSPDMVSSLLTQVLPAVVDHLTPNGQVPNDDLVQQGLALLKGKLLS